MKIKTKNTLKDLSGKELKDKMVNPQTGKVEDSGDAYTVGLTLGEIMIADEAAGKMKGYVLAQKFATSDSVEVDSSDLAIVKKAVEMTKRYNALVAGQLLVMLEGLKDEKPLETEDKNK